MGECFITRRNSDPLYQLPVLNSSYPANASVSYAYGSSTSATFSVSIATAGVPDSYTYQWYVNNGAVSGATSSSYTKTGLNEAGAYTVYCKVTNKAGTVTSRTATLTVTCSSLIFFNGTLNTTTWGTMSASQTSYTVTNSKLRVYGAGSSSTITNDFTCTKYVDLTNYSTLKLVVPTNVSVKCAVRIYNSSSKQLTAMTITASNTGTFSLDVSSITENCKILLGVSSNATTDYIEFSSIVFYK